MMIWQVDKWLEEEPEARVTSQKREGGVGYFSNERGFSTESSLQRIASNLLLWERNNSSVVL